MPHAQTLKFPCFGCKDLRDLGRSRKHVRYSHGCHQSLGLLISNFILVLPSVDVLHHGIISSCATFFSMWGWLKLAGLLLRLATSSCLPDAIPPEKRQNLVDDSEKSIASATDTMKTHFHLHMFHFLELAFSGHTFFLIGPNSHHRDNMR